MRMCAAQHEISQAALEVLQSTKDAHGRAIEVFKVPLPPNLFLGKEEADGLQARRFPAVFLLRSHGRKMWVHVPVVTPVDWL